ncbi:15077_t:CDS:2, partial [Funneliformis caledonium]
MIELIFMNIHVIVEPPESTTTSSREQELLKQVASLQALLNKSTYDFDVIVHPKRKWTSNIEHAILEGLKEYIHNYSPQSDQDLCKILRIFVSDKKLKFTVFIETPSKLFNSWIFSKVCELYELSDDLNPSIDVYPVFQCGCVNTKEEKYKEGLCKLFDELETCHDNPIDVSYEATKSIYFYSFLTSATYPFKIQIKIVPEKLVEVFKLSKPLFVAYEDEGMKDMAEKVLDQILWLLEEAQKP